MANSAMELLKSYRIWILLLGILAGAICLMVAGINFGIDFEGGTMFQVQLSEKIDSSKMEEVSNVIEKRLNWSGLQDVRVYSTSTEENNFLFIVVRNVEPKEVENLGSLITQQGRFEAKLGKDVLFTGKDLLMIDSGVNTSTIMKVSENSYRWTLPFVLEVSAARRFRDLTFHKCEPIMQTGGEMDYDCEYTYFFIDRPHDRVIVLTSQTYENDKAYFASGTAEVPAGTKIEEVLDVIDTTVIVVDTNSQDSIQKAIDDIKNALKDKKGILADPMLGDAIISRLNDLNTNVKIVYGLEKEPWLYKVSGMRSVVRLTPSVTGNKPYVERKEDMQPLTDLVITGHATSYAEASKRKEELKIILTSGSLPVSVESISTYSVSPTQGRDFLAKVAILAVIVLIAVSAIIFLRYKKPLLSIAIIFTALVEAFLTTSFTSFLGQSLDIATLAGIIAAVGTGVDDQIIITDELLRGKNGDSKEEVSLIRRAKRALFIVVAAASTTAATMLPVIFMGNVLVKIVGFAVAILIGVLVGVLITRPAYSEVVKNLI